jgi:hypothetical protein
MPETGLVIPFSRTLEESLGRRPDYLTRPMRRFESFVELEAEGYGEKVLKKTFLDLSREIMHRIKNT